MPADSPSVPVITRSTDSFLLSTCGLIVPTRSGAPALSQVTDEMMSGCSLTNLVTIDPVSFWLPATSRMSRVTGAEGLTGTLPAAALAAGLVGVDPELGAAHAVRSSPRAAMLATRCRGLEGRMNSLLSRLCTGVVVQTAGRWYLEHFKLWFVLGGSW